MGATWWFPLILVGGMVLFWGTIFGHKKQNESYRMLSRLGVADGTIWRSRMLPATLLYVPVFVCFFCCLSIEMYEKEIIEQAGWTAVLLDILPMFFTVWLVPLAMGAFVSISFRSRRTAIVFTVVGTILLLVWAMQGMNWFGCSLVWTTLPICIALLVASRLRTKDYLRNSYTWRSKFVPLTPVFAMMLAVLAALPFVRVYSIPYISWEQIETYLDQADMPERLAPDKRKALIQHIASNDALPPGHDDFFALLFHIHKERPFLIMEISTFDILEEYTYEEYLLLYYAYCRHVALNPLLYSNRDRCCPPPVFLERLRYTPWEAARVDRVLRFQIISTLVGSGSLQDEKAQSLVDWSTKWRWSASGLDRDIMEFLSATSTPEGQLIRMRLEQVSPVIENWYRRHGTFPESLDELVNTLDDFAAKQYTLLEPDDEALVSIWGDHPALSGTPPQEGNNRPSEGRTNNDFATQNPHNSPPVEGGHFAQQNGGVVTPGNGQFVSLPVRLSDITPIGMMEGASGMSVPFLPARTADGHLAWISQDVADTVSNPRPFLDAVPIHPFTKKPVLYHRNAPSPVGVVWNDPDRNIYLTERAVGNVPVDYYMGGRSPQERRELHKRQETVRKAFLKSGGTYVRLGKNVTFFVELTEPLLP